MEIEFKRKSNFVRLRAGETIDSPFIPVPTLRRAR